MGFFSNYRLQARLLGMFALVVILLFSGRQGQVQDILWEGDQAVVAVGRYGGVRLLDLSDPAHPQEIGHLDTLGDALAVGRLGDLLLVADGGAGLLVLDVRDPAHPQWIAQQALSAPVLDVAVDDARQLAFLAVGAAGVQVVDLSAPRTPTVIGGWVPNEAVRWVRYRSGRLFAASTRTVWVVDVTQLQNPQLVGSASAYSEVHDLAVVGLDLAVVAQDSPGFRAFNTAAAGTFPAQDFPPTQTSQPRATGGTAVTGRAVAAYGRGALLGGADGELYHISLLDPMQPTLSEQSRVMGAVTALEVSQDWLAVGLGPFGVQIFNLRDLTTGPLGWYETPGDYSPLQLLRLFRSGVHDTRPFIARKGIRTLALWLGLFLLMELAWHAALFFFAQFVLPVHTWQDRQQAYRYLWLYTRNKHGPALFVENGELVEREREHEKRGPGVIILDTASAAVLRTKTQFTRAVGPGLVFTSENEYIAATVPLYPRFQALGPAHEIDMDAFEQALAEGRDPPVPEALQTRAQTRDDVAVVARIGVAFRLDFDPPQGRQTLGRSRYGYQPEAVGKAVRGSRLDPSRDPETEEPLLPWDELPALIAVELWREYLQKFRFVELFDPRTGEEHGLPRPEDGQDTSWGETGLEIIQRFVRARMTQDTVLALNDVGRPRTEVPSQEYRLLKERGIRVLSVSITNLQFRRSVEQNLLRAWRSTWLQWAELESRYVDERRTYAMHRGREEGEVAYADEVTRSLGRYLLHLRAAPRGVTPPLRLEDLQQNVSERQVMYSRAVALGWLARDTRTLVVRNPQVHQAMEGLEAELSNMVSYLDRLRRKWE